MARRRVHLPMGTRSGKAAVVGVALQRKGVTYIPLRCDCGKEWESRHSAFAIGKTKSCGCASVDTRSVSQLAKDHPLYSIWFHMIERCESRTSTSFRNYGARGITVCERWRNSFAAFCEDMGPRPDGTSIDRENNNGNYEPGNCRWATLKQQKFNRRVSRIVNVQGLEMMATDAAKLCGISRESLFSMAAKCGSYQAAVDKYTASGRVNNG